jgi:hypothetical protein
MKFWRINAFNKMCAGLKGKNKCEHPKEGPHFLMNGVEAQLAI